MDIKQIMKCIPHRYPFLLVDRVLEFEPAQRVVGLKNVTVNEPFFIGHYPGKPIMPPVLIIEHAAQIACALLLSCPANADKVGLFTRMQGVKFHLQVVPGDQLITEVIIEKLSSRTGNVRFVSHVADELVAEGRFSFIIATAPESA